jgi:hypothetical protein
MSFFSLNFGPSISNDPKLMQTEGSEDKHFCAAGVEAELSRLSLTMYERVMSVDGREYCIKRDNSAPATAQRYIVDVRWILIQGRYASDNEACEKERSDQVRG